MKLEQQKKNDGYHRLSIEAEWHELAADYDDIVAGYAKISLPGFRPGKVPLSVIEKRFRKEIIDDFSLRTAQRLGRNAIREAGIEVLGPAEAEEIECNKGKSFRATVRFHSMPEITLPELNTLINGVSETDPRDRISLRLLELVSFDIPDGLVRDELALEGVDGGEPGSAGWQAASDRIRLMLILKRIALQEGIEVDEVDVNRRIADRAKEFGTSATALRSELEEGNGINRLRDMLLAESTLDYLLERNQYDV